MVRATGENLLTAPFAALLLMLLVGCGGGSGDSGDGGGDGPAVVGGGTGDEVADGGATDEDVTDEGVTTDEGATNEFAPGVASDSEAGPDEGAGAAASSVIADCDTLPLSAAVPGSSRTAPGEVSVGEPFGGEIDAEGEHYWTLTVFRGEYQLVLDTQRTDEAATRTGLQLSFSVDSGVTWSSVISTEDFDVRVREHRMFTIFASGPGADAGGELLMRVRARFGTESYHLAVLDPDEAVPSPYLFDCPEVEPLVVGTTEAFALSAAGSDGDEKWFLADFPGEASRLSLAASSAVAGSADPVDYEMRLFGPHGQLFPAGVSGPQTFSFTGTTFATDTVTFVPPTSGASLSQFMRFRNLGGALNVEAALVRR